MSLKKEIQETLSESLKEGNELTSMTLRLLLASAQSKEKDKRYELSKENPDLDEKELDEKSSLTDEEIVNIIASEAKKRKEAIAGFEKGGRIESAEKEKKELEILQKYLPEQMSEEELRNIIKEAVEKTGAQDMKDIGKVMGEIMPKVKGKADGGDVNKIVRELLTS